MVSLASYLEGLTKKQLEVAVGILALDKGVDLITGGRLNKLSKRILVATGKRLIPFAARAGVSVAGTAVGMSRLAMLNPYVLGATAIYVGYHERERIKQLLEQGYEIIEERIPTPSLPSLPSPGIPTLGRPSIPGVEEIILGGPAALPMRPRKPSSFNKAVSQGMKVVKKSTSYGGKGEIKPAKKAFTVVVKLAAAKKKKKKAPKSGLRRRIWNAMKVLR